MTFCSSGMTRVALTLEQFTSTLGTREGGECLERRIKYFPFFIGNNAAAYTFCATLCRSVIIFRGPWQVAQVLKPSDLAMQDYFGHSVAQYRSADSLLAPSFSHHFLLLLRCRHVLIGAWGADSSSYVSLGAAYVYMYSSAGWELEAKVGAIPRWYLMGPRHVQLCLCV